MEPNFYNCLSESYIERPTGSPQTQISQQPVSQTQELFQLLTQWQTQFDNDSRTCPLTEQTVHKICQTRAASFKRICLLNIYNIINTFPSRIAVPPSSNISHMYNVTVPQAGGTHYKIYRHNNRFYNLIDANTQILKVVVKLDNCPKDPTQKLIIALKSQLNDVSIQDRPLLMLCGVLTFSPSNEWLAPEIHLDSPVTCQDFQGVVNMNRVPPLTQIHGGEQLVVNDYYLPQALNLQQLQQVKSDLSSNNVQAIYSAFTTICNHFTQFQQLSSNPISVLYHPTRKFWDTQFTARIHNSNLRVNCRKRLQIPASSFIEPFYVEFYKGFCPYVDILTALPPEIEIKIKTIYSFDSLRVKQFQQIMVISNRSSTEICQVLNELEIAIYSGQQLIVKEILLLS
ncbi:hypothetical protein ABPG72_005298 [Tetrahymena utriculariae]